MRTGSRGARSPDGRGRSGHSTTAGEDGISREALMPPDPAPLGPTVLAPRAGLVAREPRVLTRGAGSLAGTPARSELPKPPSCVDPSSSGSVPRGLGPLDAENVVQGSPRAWIIL